MRYILDDSGYIYSVSCNPIECDSKGCTGYTGAVPEGYDSIEQWATTANIRAYKIVNGNLTYDANRAAELEAEWNQCESLLDALFYKSGDTFSISSLNCTGHLTSSKTQMVFSIPTVKRLNNINTIKLGTIYVVIRHSDGGYIASNVKLDTLGTLAVAKDTDNSIRVTLTLSTATTFTNNCPIAVYLYNGTITFN